MYFNNSNRFCVFLENIRSYNWMSIILCIKIKIFDVNSVDWYILEC